MKKIVISLITLSVLISSCQNDESSIENQAYNVEKLNSDKKFQVLVAKNLAFNYKVINQRNKNNIDLIYNNNIKQLSENLNYDNSINFTNDLNSQLEIVNYIIAKYDVKKYNELELKELIIREINETESSKAYAGGVGGGGDSCRRRFNNDLIIIAAASIAGHIACGTVDLTVILGGLCHAAVYASQIAASDNALLDFQSCVN